MLLSKTSTDSCGQFTDHRVEVVKVIPQGRYQRRRKSRALGDMFMDDGLNGMIQETEGDGDFRQCTVEQTHGMPVHAEFHSTRHRHVLGRGRGEEAPVPQIQEFDAVVRGNDDRRRDSCRAADQPGVLIQGRSA